MEPINHVTAKCIDQLLSIKKDLSRFFPLVITFSNDDGMNFDQVQTAAEANGLVVTKGKLAHEYRIDVSRTKPQGEIMEKILSDMRRPGVYSKEYEAPQMCTTRYRLLLKEQGFKSISESTLKISVLSREASELTSERFVDGLSRILLDLDCTTSRTMTFEVDESIEHEITNALVVRELSFVRCGAFVFHIFTKNFKGHTDYDKLWKQVEYAVAAKSIIYASIYLPEGVHITDNIEEFIGNSGFYRSMSGGRRLSIYPKEKQTFRIKPAREAYELAKKQRTNVESILKDIEKDINEAALEGIMYVRVQPKGGLPPTGGLYDMVIRILQNAGYKVEVPPNEGILVVSFQF